MGWLSVGAGPVRVGTRGFSVGAGGVRAGASWSGGRHGGGGGGRADSSYDHPALVQARDEHLEWADRVLAGIEADGLEAHKKIYKRLLKNARWLDKLHAECCGLQTFFRAALVLEVREIAFRRQLDEAASSFAGKTNEEVAKLVFELNQVALQLDRACLAAVPERDPSTLSTHRLFWVTQGYVNENPGTTISVTWLGTDPRTTPSPTAAVNSGILDRVISLSEEINAFPSSIVDRLEPSAWLREMVDRVAQGRCAEIDVESWERMERELIDLKRSIILG